ncbi:MAG: acetolactate synthase large subunit [Alphaproteobacteria bacterium]
MPRPRVAASFLIRLRGAPRVAIERLQYFAEAALEQLQGISHLVLAGTKAPVSFFAYPDVPSLLVPEDCKAVPLSNPAEDTLSALAELADAVGADSTVKNRQTRIMPDMPESGAIDPVKVWQIMARMMPEGAVLAEEAATSSFGADMFLGGAAPFEHLQLTGGSIGYGLPVAVGAAVACPDRKVICPHGDGGAMYTIQALWTMARDNLDVTTVIFANRSYAILNIELMRVGAENPGRKALDMLDIGRPDLNFVQLAQGMGVEASRATTTEEFASQFESAMGQRGPRLIEVVL